MTQPFHEVKLALERRELVNPAINYDPQSRAMPVISMQPLPSTIIPTATQPSATHFARLPQMSAPPYPGPAHAGPSAAEIHAAYVARARLSGDPVTFGVFLFSLLLSPWLWFTVALLVLFSQFGTEQRTQPAPRAAAPMATQRMVPPVQRANPVRPVPAQRRAAGN